MTPEIDWAKPVQAIIAGDWVALPKGKAQVVGPNRAGFYSVLVDGHFYITDLRNTPAPPKPPIERWTVEYADGNIASTLWGSPDAVKRWIAKEDPTARVVHLREVT